MELLKTNRSFAEKIRDLAQQYLTDDKKASTTRRSCAYISQNELSILNINNNSSAEPGELQVDNLKLSDLQTTSSALKAVVRKNDLTIAPMTWMLTPDLYQVNILESIPIPANELKAALSWRVRGLINYPIEQAVLEHFELPAKNSAQNVNLIGVVTAEKNKLQNTITLLDKAGLNLVAIDVPEFALLKLTTLYEVDEQVSAFLYFFDTTLILNISYQKVLYFTRHIPLSSSPTTPINYEKLSFEILKYFDFFRTQWRLEAPTRIFTAVEKGDSEAMASTLTLKLARPVIPYTVMNKALLNKQEDATVFAQNLLSYACLLRKDDKQ